MNFNFIRSIAVVFFSIGCAVQAAPEASSNAWENLHPDRDQVIASLNLVEVLDHHHYNKQPLNDAFSEKIFQGYLKLLDPAKLFFTAADVTQLASWEDNFDNFLKQGDLNPGFSMYQTFLKRQQERIEFVLKLLAQGTEKLDFNSQETFLVDRENAPWAKDTQELDTLWRQRLTDDVLRLKLTDKDPKAISELLTKRYQNQLKRAQQTLSEDMFQAYMNAYTEVYDPHTNYLSPENAENFDINMSLSLQGIGAVLQSDNDYVKVLRLVPGGPAEKSRLLAPADRIISVGQGDEPLQDVIGWRLDEVVKLIRGPKDSVVRLEVIPATNAPNDLSSKKISLTREAVKLEDQAVSKATVQITQNGQAYKVGIITIPAFYQDFKARHDGKRDYRSTTQDVKALLKKLEAEKVSGVILDLRDNGGGSLQEATELTGLFIDKGPTVLIRNSQDQVEVLEDKEAGIFYAGPLIVLINRLSASASEIFAGAMQDYHRALIVGTQTFGKGTVQTIEPLSHGELKFTVAKFYRVSGDSTQHKGVLPDIAYPSLLNIEKIGENALENALPWDTIKPSIEPPANPFTPYLQTLKERHLARVIKDPEFLFIEARKALSEELLKQTTVSLNEGQRRAEQKELDARALTIENNRRVAKGEKPLTELEKVSDEHTPVEPEKTKPEKDAYLMETARVLLDYLELSKASGH